MSDNGRNRAQTFLSTRSGTTVIPSFETVVLKGLAADGGLFLPAEIPIADWVCQTFENPSIESK